MRQTWTALGMVFALAIWGCTKSPAATEPIETLPRALTAAEQEVIGASNRFAFDLLREVDARDGDGNLLLSPISASMALGMTMNGTAGETYQQMRAALGFDNLEPAQINASYRALIDLLLDLDPTIDTRIANSIWYREGFPFKESFFEVARGSFSAEVAALPFVPSDRDRINAWVDRATAGRIPSIVEEIDADDVMFLINAVYFKGNWVDSFDPQRTQDDTFRRADGTTQPVRMMNRRGSYDRVFGEDFQAVEIPYGRTAFAMTVVLPTEGNDLDGLIASLDAEGWRALTESLQPGDLLLSLPRFRLEYKQSLVGALRALGMNLPFDAGQADFSGMSDAAANQLVLSDVLQKSFVEVDEEGTEAAAATVVGVEVVSMPPSIRVDRPFLFAIRERLTGTILFVGKVVAPE